MNIGVHMDINSGRLQFPQNRMVLQNMMAQNASAFYAANSSAAKFTGS
jgi:hypothetical protein